MRRFFTAALFAAVALVGGGGVAFADPAPAPAPSGPAASPSPSPTAPFRARDTAGDNPFTNVPGVGDSRRIGESQGAAVDNVCTRPPKPQKPFDTVAGLIDHGPVVEASPGSWYATRGYAGFSLPIYDPGCAPGLNSMQKRVFDPPNTFAVGLIGASLATVAVVAVASRFVIEGTGLGQVLDGFVTAVHGTVAAPILLNPWFFIGGVGLAFTVLAWRANKAADVPGTAKGSAAIVAIILGALLVLSSAFAVGPAYDSATKEAYRAAAATWQGDRDDPVDVFVADQLIQRGVFPLWARTLLGNNPQAIDKYAWRLYAAGSYTVAEEAKADASPQAAREMLDKKQADFRAVAAEMKTSDPDAYAHLSGVDTLSRPGPPIVMFLTVLIIAAVALASILAVGAGKAAVRVALAGFPLGALAWVQPALQTRLVDAGRVVWSLVKIAFVGVVAFVTVMAAVLGAGGTAGVANSSAGLGGRAVALLLVVALLVYAWKRRAQLVAKSATAREAAKANDAVRKVAQAVNQAAAPVTARVRGAAGRVGERVEKDAGRRFEARDVAAPVDAGRKGRRVQAKTVSGLVASARDERAKKKTAPTTGGTPTPRRAKAAKGRVGRVGRRLRRSDVAAAAWTPNASTADVAPSRRAPVRRPRVKKAATATASVQPSKQAAPVLLAPQSRKVLIKR